MNFIIMHKTIQNGIVFKKNSVPFIIFVRSMFSEISSKNEDSIYLSERTMNKLEDIIEENNKVENLDCN